MGKEERGDKPETVTLSLRDLEAIVDARVKAAQTQVAPATPALADDDFEAQMRRMRKPGARIWYEECESPLTGARWRAKIMDTRSSPLGRVIDLEDYVYPVGYDVPVSQGGKCPDEQLKDSARHAFWLYWEFQRRDRAEFASGKLFSTYLRQSEADARREREKASLTAASSSETG
jgi:hypothetical protein